MIHECLSSSTGCVFCCPWFHFHGDEPHFYHRRLGNHREEFWSESLAKPTPHPKRPGGFNQGDHSVPAKQWCLLLFILTHPGDTIITCPSLWRSVGSHPFGAMAMQSNLEHLRGFTTALLRSRPLNQSL